MLICETIDLSRASSASAARQRRSPPPAPLPVLFICGVLEANMDGWTDGLKKFIDGVGDAISGDGIFIEGWDD
jgi:hypothetical protein